MCTQDTIVSDSRKKLTSSARRLRIIKIYYTLYAHHTVITIFIVYDSLAGSEYFKYFVEKKNVIKNNKNFFT